MFKMKLIFLGGSSRFVKSKSLTFVHYILNALLAASPDPCRYIEYYRYITQTANAILLIKLRISQVQTNSANLLDMVSNRPDMDNF